MKTANNRTLAVTFLLLGLAILLAACSDLADQNQPEAEATGEVQVTEEGVEQSRGAQNADTKLSTLGGEIAGFGGLFYDEQGNLNVHVKQGELGSMSTEDLEATLGEYLERPSSSDLGAQARDKRELKVLEADYTFRDLAAWRSQLDESWTEGMTLTDADEKLNRVRVGVENAQAKAAVEERLAEEGIPAEAVVVEEIAPATPSAGLQDQVRPLIGGLQIVSDRGTCTLGFNATINGTPGFVTNSHCTNEQGGTEGTTYTQGGGVVGTEAVDPENSAGLEGCSEGRRCRFSDSAFVASDAGRQGYIAWTQGENNPSAPDLEIASQLRVIGTEGTSVVGDELEKIGATTGRSRGNVVATCVTRNFFSDGRDTGITYLCQDRVTGVNGPGDSGGPVFRYAGNGEVYLRGVSWGFDLEDGSIIEFSPINQIFGELSR